MYAGCSLPLSYATPTHPDLMPGREKVSIFQKAVRDFRYTDVRKSALFVLSYKIETIK